MARILIKNARVLERDGRWFVCHPSNDAILADCETPAEAQGVVRQLDALCGALARDAVSSVGAAEREAYIGFVNAQTGRKPVGFTKRQAEDLKAGYGDGFGQGVICTLAYLGIKVQP